MSQVQAAQRIGCSKAGWKAWEHFRNPTVAAETTKEAEPQHTATAAPTPAPPAPGRGGRGHKRLQQLFRRQAQSLGYKASTEHALAAGAGSVDLWLQRDADIIACEISISPTSLAQELKNVRKCLEAGASAVCLVAPTVKRLSALKRQLEEQLQESERPVVLFQLPDDFLDWLQERALAAMDSETRSRGYRVKLSREGVSEADQSARKKTLAQILGRLLRKDE